jgi:hypothetical protein
VAASDWQGAAGEDGATAPVDPLLGSAPPPYDQELAGLHERRGPVDFMREALALYRQHARAFLLTAAALFVPGSFMSSCALSATLGPLIHQAESYEDAGQRVAERSQALAKRMEEQVRKGGAVDSKALAELAQESHRNWQEMGRAGGNLTTVFKKVVAIVLGLLGWLLFAIILYGMILPLTQGALTVAVADRMQGGRATWLQNWSILLRYKGPLLSALLPAALLGFVGYLFLLLPGMLISCFFSFVSPVVLLEGLGGQAALKRSFALVRSDWFRVALLLLSFGILNWLAHGFAALILPTGAIFWSLFLADLISLVLMPVPIILSALLYLDIRRTHDGITREQLAAQLAALRLAR